MRRLYLRVVGRAHVCCEEGSVGRADVETRCTTLTRVRTPVVRGRAHVDILVLVIDENGVLTFRSLPVVQPSLRVLRFGREVPVGEVLTGSQLAEPTLTHRVDDEVAKIEIAMGLMTYG